MKKITQNETLNKMFSVNRDAEDTMSSGKLFQTFEAATGNAPSLSEVVFTASRFQR